MRLLLLRGNPRKDGYTQRFTDLFLEGAAESADVRDVDLCEKNIASCLGCYHCWLKEQGECVHDDDMSELLEEVIAADVLACASPLYFYSLSSYIQRFLERTFPLTRPGLETTQEGLFRNRLCYPDRWKNKKIIFLVTGALRDLRNFRPCQETCRLIAGGLAMKLGGVITRPESHVTSFSAAKPVTLRSIEAAFIDAGRHAARTGIIPEAVLKAAREYVEPNPEMFRGYSEIYWDTARAMGADAMDTAALVSKTSADVRLMIQGMVASVDPASTSRTTATLQFNFKNPVSNACVVISKGIASVTWADSEDPDLRLACDSQTWFDIANGALNPLEALKQGLLSLDGDRSLYLRLPRFFPIVG